MNGLYVCVVAVVVEVISLFFPHTINYYFSLLFPLIFFKELTACKKLSCKPLRKHNSQKTFTSVIELTTLLCCMIAYVKLSAL